jgi:hypothetical protein
MIEWRLFDHSLRVRDDRDPAVSLPHLNVVTINVLSGVRFGRLVIDSCKVATQHNVAVEPYHEGAVLLHSGVPTNSGSNMPENLGLSVRFRTQGRRAGTNLAPPT